MKTSTESRKQTDGVDRPDATAADARHMAALVALSPDIIVVASPDRRVLFWSKGAEVSTGWSAQEAAGADFFGLLLVPADTEADAAFERVAAGAEWDGEFGIVTHVGTERTLHGRWKCMPADHGTEGDVVMINADVTAMKEKHEELLRAERLAKIGELACGVAHDLSNALAPIVIGADALEYTQQDGESPEMVQMIRESAERATHIVRQMLHFIRTQDGGRISPPREAEPLEPPQAKALDAEGTGELVIVAEDEPVVANMCRRMLEKHGYRVEVAADGVEALALFGDHRASVRAVITDMAMPRMDGIGLVRAIRQLDPKVPIVIASGWADETQSDALKEFESVSLLDKPYSRSTLLEALKMCLGPATVPATPGR